MNDVIVIGGGHNGLAAAALLARAGRKVTVLEARPDLGGLCAGEPFADGYRTAGTLHHTSSLRTELLAPLDLAAHGLRLQAAPRVWAPCVEGPPVWRDGGEVGGAIDDGDAARFTAWLGFVDRVGGVLGDLLSRPPPDPGGSIWPLLRRAVAVRRLGTADMVELMRVLPMCAADWLRDALGTERLRAALAVPAMEGAFTGPWSGGTAMSLLFREAVRGPEVAGGPAALVEALAAAAAAHGVELRTGARVQRIRVGASGVVGVSLDSGDQLDARVVAASCDPKQLLALVERNHLPLATARDLELFRARGTTAKIDLALSGPLELADGTAVEALVTGETLDEVEQAFDPVKYGELAELPVLDVRVPSMRTEGLCPDGHHVVSVLAHAVPLEARDLDAASLRDAVGRRVVAALARVCPSVTDRIVARRVRTPADLAGELGLSGGHLHHGEHAFDQLLFMRPSVDCAQYATPIPGLYLSGSGAHPGGGVTAAPGALAARAMVESRR